MGISTLQCLHTGAYGGHADGDPTQLSQGGSSSSRRRTRCSRHHLRTGSGMAAALTALNQVFGDVYDVDAAEIQDQQAFAEKWPAGGPWIPV